VHEERGNFLKAFVPFRRAIYHPTGLITERLPSVCVVGEIGERWFSAQTWQVTLASHQALCPAHLACPAYVMRSRVQQTDRVGVAHRKMHGAMISVRVSRDRWWWCAERENAISKRGVGPLHFAPGIP
jgi:hypothetical protein